ncbi:MAG: DegT/DnrJ/EryC1/StrS aminotransferase family protein [Phycisphaerae bacterium]|jgi:hypothetical protein
MPNRRLIEQTIERAFPGHAVFVPSARFGLMLAFEHFLSAGDKVLLTSACCETVVFALYAAGVKPVFVDLEENSGNIDCAALARLDVPDARAVLAIHLYGVPDDLAALGDLCKRRDWLLLEDCAQVLDSYSRGLRAGSVGQAAVYSFPKFFDEPGGAILCREAGDAEALRRRADHLAERPSWPQEWLRRIQAAIGLRGAWIREGLGRWARRVGRRPSPPATTVRETAPLRVLPAELADSLRGNADGNGAREPARRHGLAGFRTYPPAVFVRRLAGKLAEVRRLADRIREENDRLCRECPLPMCPPARFADPCHLAVPFRTTRREPLRRAIEAHTGQAVYYIYDPPLTDYLPVGSYTDCRQDPWRDRRWCSEVLPIRGSLGPESVAALRKALHGAANAAEAEPTPAAS